jgi:hypothetical protein
VKPFPFGFGEGGKVAYDAGVPGTEGGKTGEVGCGATEPLNGVLGGPGVQVGPNPDDVLRLIVGEPGNPEGPNVLEGKPRPTPEPGFGVGGGRGDCGRPLDGALKKGD